MRPPTLYEVQIIHVDESKDVIFAALGTNKCKIEQITWKLSHLGLQSADD